MLRFSGFMLIIALVFTACSGGAVIFAPTPAPYVASPEIYTHPEGAFSLVLPSDWALYEPESALPASAAFAPPGSSEPLVQIAVVRLGEVIEAGAMPDLIRQYQTQIRADADHYQEQDRLAMNDGSWRITGLRTKPGGAAQALNTFFERAGGLFSVLEVIMPLDAGQQSEIQTIINTYALNASAPLPVAQIFALASTASAQLQILNLAEWETVDGVFFITGEVANHGGQPVTDVPVRALLLDANGQPVAEAITSSMGYAVMPGGFAPFSLRFGQGQPPGTLTYTLSAGGSDWQPADAGAVVAGDALTWTSELETSDAGLLYIRGTLTNTSGVRVHDARAVATVFDSQQAVIGAGWADVTSPILAPGGVSDFTIAIPDLGSNAANVIVDVQALRCDDSGC